MSVGRSTLLVAGCAALSRILGFVRDMLTAGLFGAGPVADALLLALRIPNALRRVLGEGGLNAGFVPIHARLALAGTQAAGRFGSASLASVGTAVLALAALVHALAPWIVLALGGHGGDPSLPDLAMGYLRAAMPFLVGATLASLAGAWLNAERRYAAAALAPLAVNVWLIAVLWILYARGGDPVANGLVFAASWSLAGLVQLACLIPAMRRLPLAWPHWRDVAAPEQRSLLMRAGPAMAASGAAQLIVLAATAAASQTPGAIAWLYYAERLVQMPLGFVSAAAGIVILPEIAARLGAGDSFAAHAAQNRALEAMLALALPSAAALAALAQPIVSVLFGRGAFGAADVTETAAMLAGLAPGLAAACVGKVLAQSAFAAEDVRAPLVAAALGIAVTLVLGFAAGPGGSLALGLSVSAGLAAQALVLAAFLYRDGRWRPDIRLGLRCGGMAVASAVMAAAVASGAVAAEPWLDPAAGTVTRATALVSLCLLGIGVYGILATVLRAIDWREVSRAMQRG